MNTGTRLGLSLFGIAILSLGIEHVTSGNFPAALVPASTFIPGRLVLVYVLGTVLVTTGTCITIQKGTRLAGVVLGIVLFLLVLVVHLPKLIANPFDGGAWTVFAELVALAGGAFLAAGYVATDLTATPRSRTAYKLIWYGYLLYALPLLIFGILHFQYASYIATLIPSWIPGPLFWAYFVGVAFVATAVSILLHKQIPLAASLLGLMFLLWVVLLHAPRVVARLHVEAEWTSMFIALAMGGISVSLAGSALNHQWQPWREKSSLQ